MSCTPDISSQVLLIKHLGMALFIHVLGEPDVSWLRYRASSLLFRVGQHEISPVCAAALLLPMPP